MLFEIFRFVQDDKLGFVSPTVGANCVRPPNCHSEPLGEESRSARVYFVRLEILRFAQDDKLGFVYPTVWAGLRARPLILM